MESPKVGTAVEHTEMLKVMRHTPGQNSERQFGIESPVIASTGVGADMGELYAAARGVGIRERLRILIDLDAARANSIGELAELLDSHGVGLTLHGGGLAEGLRDLNAKADWAYGELRAAVVALNDVIDSHDPDLVVEAREEIERRERTLLECRRQLDVIRSAARNSGVGLPEWICKERNDEPANEHEQRNGIRSDGRHVLPEVRSDTADGANEHHAGVGSRYDSGGGREPEAQPAGRGTSEREFDALITESRASINESAALVDESDAQEATLRSQRDSQVARRDQEERTRVHRKGKTL